MKISMDSINYAQIVLLLNVFQLSFKPNRVLPNSFHQSRTSQSLFQIDNGMDMSPDIDLFSKEVHVSNSLKAAFCPKIISSHSFLVEILDHSFRFL